MFYKLFILGKLLNTGWFVDASWWWLLPLCLLAGNVARYERDK